MRDTSGSWKSVLKLVAPGASRLVGATPANGRARSLDVDEAGLPLGTLLSNHHRASG
jgi:hypothetical protein